MPCDLVIHLVPMTMTPTGVEHIVETRAVDASGIVPLTMTPTSVEHTPGLLLFAWLTLCR